MGVRIEDHPTMQVLLAADCQKIVRLIVNYYGGQLSIMLASDCQNV